MIERMRRRGMHRLVAVTLFGLMTSTPVQAVQAQDDTRLQDLVAAVGALDEDMKPVVQPEVFEAIGQGQASYYGNELAGNRTASGERFNPQLLTAAHRSLPLGTKLRVTNLSNGRSVIVRVNDRGPFARGRILDVSLAAAREIGMIRSGSAEVRLEVVRNA